ncbi:MAG: hypothetical protein GY765_19285, partial [bacterium]|nr:hypothetical protein [bacterium]
MMKKLFICCFLLLSFFLLNAEKIGNLDVPLKKVVLGTIHDGKVYLYDYSSFYIRVYSLKELKPLFKFGGKGEGPGEFIGISNLIVSSKNISVDSTGKTSYFTLSGSLIKEIRTPQTGTF